MSSAHDTHLFFHQLIMGDTSGGGRRPAQTRRHGQAMTVDFLSSNLHGLGVGARGEERMTSKGKKMQGGAPFIFHSFILFSIEK